MSFAENLKRIRKSKGLSQKELAEKLGVSQPSYAQYERGTRNPKIETLNKIAQALNTTVEELSDHTLSYFECTLPVSALQNMDENDIKEDLYSLREKLKNKEYGPVSYDGQDIPEEDIDLFIGQVDLMLQRLKNKNKEKSDPNKNKTE